MSEARAMKDSGVEWLGAVPEGWEVAPLWSMVSTKAGGTPNSDEVTYWGDDSDVAWISIGDMGAVRRRNAHQGRFVTAEGMQAAGLTVAEPPVVLFAMYASVGEVALLHKPAVWNQAILGLVPNKRRLDSVFLYYALANIKRSLPYLFRSNTQDNLNASQVRSLRLATPPLNEQRAIAGYLDERTARIDEAIEIAREGIALAKERRSALISAAVTGKLDVAEAA